MRHLKCFYSTAIHGIKRLTRRDRSVVDALLDLSLVDDDQAIRGVLQGFLEADGHTVCLSTTGSDPRLRELDMQDIDVLVSDIVMPDLDGFTVAQQLTARYPEIKTLLISGYHPALPERDALDQWPFLAKPFTAEEFRQKFTAVLQTVHPAARDSRPGGNSIPVH